MISNPTPEPVTPPDDETLQWRRAHPAYMLTALLRNLRGFILPAAILLVGNLGGDRSRAQSLVFLAISALIVVLSGIGGVLQWWFYRYALAPDRLLVRSGMIFRQERVIPYQRIQTVDLEEAPLDRLFGVARMKIETAAGGTSQSEVTLNAVRREEAAALRERLLRARGAARDDTTQVSDDSADAAAGSLPAETGSLLRALSTRDLLLAGATSGTIGPAAAIIGVVIQFADDLVPETWWERVPWDDISGATSNLSLIAALAMVIALFSWLLAIAGTVLTYYGFELRQDGEHLVVQYGLLDRRRTTIPIRRIQAIQVDEGLLRQPFRYASVRYVSAGRAGASEGGSGMLFPMMPRREIRALLEAAAPSFAAPVDAPPLRRLPRRSLPRYIIGDTIATIVVIGIAMAGIRAWQDGLPWWGYLLLAWVPVQVVLGWLGWRDAGWATANGRLLLRTRGAGRTTFIAPIRRLQHRRLTTNPLQRRADLTTLHVAVASGGLGGHRALPHMDASEAKALLHALNPRRP